MISDREKLADLRLVPTPMDRFRRLPAQTKLQVPIRGLAPAQQRSGATGSVETIPLPFFWYNPPWHQATLERSRFVADLVGERGVIIAALQSELSQNGGGLDGITWPRLAVHRCDRAGWNLADAQSATVIELRLGMDRDAAGAYAYSAAQMERWNSGETPPKQSRIQSLAPLLFPPEWTNLSQLGAKVSQLRSLGDAAIYVSCDEASIDDVLPAAIAGGSDGVILRCQHDPVSALRRVAIIAGGNSQPVAPDRHLRIWLVSGKLEPEDAVKCFALGASAISLDWMCDRWLLDDDEERLTAAQRTAINLGLAGQTLEERIQSQVRKRIDSYSSRIAGIVQSLFVTDVTQLSSSHLCSA
jgi:hypothetical protein